MSLATAQRWNGFSTSTKKRNQGPDHPRKFNTYRFTDYKENVIDLIKRVSTVSVMTVSILESMKRGARMP
jgi:hypothetical protein